MTKKARHRGTIEPKKQAKSRELRPTQIHLTFAWFDGGHRWCDGAKTYSHFFDIAKKLKWYESMDWKDTFARDHAVNVSSIIPEAQRRLTELKLDDVDQLWRFRLDGATRLWGLRIGSCFFALWWDPEHKICPSCLRHT